MQTKTPNSKHRAQDSPTQGVSAPRPESSWNTVPAGSRSGHSQQSAVSLRLLSRPHSSHSPLQTRSQPTTAAGAAQCSPPNMDNEHIWCEIVRQWDWCSQSYSYDMVIYDSKIWLQDFWHGWDLTWIWCFFSWSDSDRVGLWQWPVIVFRRPSKLIFYIFTLCGMWIKIMRETATKYNLCHPNCIDVQYEQYQQCECLTNQHTGESELLWSTISMEWAWMRFTVILSDVQSKSRLVHTCHGESSSSCCWDRKRADARSADCSTPWFPPCLSVN